MAIRDKYNKQSYFINGKEIKLTGYSIAEGMKRLWIPTHRFWAEVPIDEPDDVAIARITYKYNNLLQFKMETNGKDPSKDLQ